MNRLGTILRAGRALGVRDGVLRLEYELQRSSGLMSRRMRSAEGWESWDLHRVAPSSSAEKLLAFRRDDSHKFFFHDARALGSSIENCIGIDGKKTIIAEAERILEGHLPFFGQLSFDCDFPPRWFRNSLTGQSVPPQQPWTQMRFASPEYGDLKFILEPSRFLFVYPLVRAYALSGDERFAYAFWNAIEDWARHNPPMSGPLWICGQECSLRILAWSFALYAFIQSPATTNKRIALLVSMIAAHAWRTAQTLGYARSQRSNHLISEAVGLWTAGILYPELCEAQEWQNLGAQLLQEAILDQITPEGVSHQHSFNYQRMILQLLLWTLRLAEIKDAHLHPVIRGRAKIAFDFIRTWVDSNSGFAPNYGSNDGSLILPLATCSYRDFRPLLQLGAAVLNRPLLPDGPWDEAALWLGSKSTDFKPAPGSPPSAETGYFRLGDESSWALIRAGRYARRAFQADQLHVDLWWKGVNLARDAGTYLYNGSSPWNNGFARTAVHNTIIVDHRDQMRRAGRFLWLDWAQASGRAHSLRQFQPSDVCLDYFEGEHDGYAQFGVRHRRTVQWLGGAGWVIVDDVEGTDLHHVRLHWLLADFPCDVSHLPFQIACKVKQSLIRWSIFVSSPSSSLVIRAGKQLSLSSAHNSDDQSAKSGVHMLGWESPTYGDLNPAISLVCETQAPLPVRFVTAILTSERCDLESRDNQLRIFQDASEIYCESLTANSMHIAQTTRARANAVTV